MTLLYSNMPEVKYVALRNVLLLIQKRPDILQDEMKARNAAPSSPGLFTPGRKLTPVTRRCDIRLACHAQVFFCEYNDPIYVKLAKLEIMVRKATAGNVELVLSELKEYGPHTSFFSRARVCHVALTGWRALLPRGPRLWGGNLRYATEIDVDFVRKSVRAIGICAVKIERAADRCIDVLLELIQTKVSYVVQEAVVVIKVRQGVARRRHRSERLQPCADRDLPRACGMTGGGNPHASQDIFRKYPNRYERIIGTLCENLETLDEPEAKVWRLPLTPVAAPTALPITVAGAGEVLRCGPRAHRPP